MVFSSLLFLFAFLTPQLCIYYAVRTTKARNIVLLIFSLIFYAFGGPVYLFLLLGEAFIAYFSAKEIGKARSRKFRKLWLFIGIILLLGLLMFFKYTGFILGNVQRLFGVPKEIPEIILPIGISFYTFQLLSYVVDVYRREVPAQKKYFNILLYCSLFHQCIAGPIVRYETVQNEINHRTIDVKDVSAGMRRFIIGLAKKAILANGCAAVADTILASKTLSIADASTVSLWVSVFAYMLQIYLDFSAYSDMAIGMGRMVGFHYLENFNYPYEAKSVQDFWRRWHISLSTFFRDYVYIPLGGNRKGFGRTILNMFIVWFLTGMWHGASWNYILWGLYFFVFLALERLFLGKILDKNKFTRFLGHIYTLIIVFFGWVLFKFTDLTACKEVVKGLLGRGHVFWSIETKSLILNNIFFLIIATVGSLSIGNRIRKAAYVWGNKKSKQWMITTMRVLDIALPVLLLGLSVLALVGDSYNPFLYFQF